MKNTLKLVVCSLIIFIIIVIGNIIFKKINKDNIDNNKILVDGVAVEDKFKTLEELTEDDFTFQSYMENKYYIVLTDNIVYNKEELDKFISNVNSNIPDKIRIIQMNFEENITIKDVEFNKNKFIVKYDNRWDGDLAEEDRIILTNEYDIKNYKLLKENIQNRNDNLKNFYQIKLVANNNLDSIYLCDYLEIKINNETNFELEFNKDLSKEREIILLKSENTLYDYDIYSYNGTINIIINGEKLSLRDALLTNKITIDQILEKVNKDVDEYKIIYKSSYADGGTTEYFYNDYIILKFNAMNFVKSNQDDSFVESYNKDLYFGYTTMDMSKLEKLYYNIN